MHTNTENLQVVVLAAGKGKRMKSDLPKVLHKLCGLTLLERAIRSVRGLSPKRITIVAGHGEALVRDHLESVDFGSAEMRIAVQSEQNGTGHAVLMAFDDLDPEVEDVLIIPGDTPLLREATYEPLLHNREAVVSVLTSVVENPYGFGRIERANDGSVKAIVEDRDCSDSQRSINEINSSVYLAKQSFLREVLPKLGSNNAQGEIYLTDIVGAAVKQGRSVRGAVCEHSSHVAGANSRYELALLEVVRRHEINKHWMDEGVTFEDFRTAYIDEDVELGRDCLIGPGVSISGRCVLGAGVCVEAHSTIQSCNISEGAHVKFSSHLEQAEVGPRCMIGPFARVRPQTKLGAEVRLGNFVETKKAEFGAGAKANHLSYIGDARVGPKTNIGAGTITCNYDGYNKHVTNIGTDVFIGSNTALVAPVTISDGAIVGAGSTITKDVPKDALGVARARQNNVEEYALRKRREHSKD
ncbi:MAG: bifunctional UDP-N-acetylglucosamine diphosphorylase/glucosamine-1-phosphate N-acetyltransferase GlmU [Bdellovibrionales bacterium]|nr:bifunctional UDP-N-acetylglucosamine diphosphorylase/glucosamine-1-phosphate N-acetyltransferase GlmU [Bdellovibrionales bacterium]